MNRQILLLFTCVLCTLTSFGKPSTSACLQQVDDTIPSSLSSDKIMPSPQRSSGKPGDFKVKPKTREDKRTMKEAERQKKMEEKIKKSKIEYKDVYLFGIGAAFGDTVVYVTEIGHLENIPINKVTQFLPRRSEYTLQLTDYLQNELNLTNRTCSVQFSTKKKKAEKKYKKVLEKYRKSKEPLDVRILNQSTFAFKRLDHTE